MIINNASDRIAYTFLVKLPHKYCEFVMFWIIIILHGWCFIPELFFSETLPVEFMGEKPLCMSQYYEVLSSCRIPGLKRDSIVNHAKSMHTPKHITVVHNFQVRSISLNYKFVSVTTM